jgi:hypothetical protein
VLSVKKRGHDADQWLNEANLALALAPWLSPDLAADLHPGLLLELALDLAMELACTLELESQLWRSTRHCIRRTRKDEDMKRLMVVVAVCLAVSVPSFAAEHVVTHSAKVAGKDTYKAAKYSVKETGKFLKFVF